MAIQIILRNMNREKVRKTIEEVMAESMDDPILRTGLEAIRKAYDKKIWLVGGFISDKAIQRLYGDATPCPKDVNLMLDRILDLGMIATPPGWYRTKTNFGNLRFKKESDQIDIWCLPGMKATGLPGHELTIEEYLDRVPLTIQSLAYDLEEGRILGSVGIDSIAERTVGVLSAIDAQEAASKRGQTIEQYLQIKAKKIGFYAELPHYAGKHPEKR